jgi:DNA-directed RNA polymerase subunit RPC12/RpoP
MEPHTLDGHLGRPVTVDLCGPCQAIWFDSRENLQLTPGATLSLFRLIGEHIAKPGVAEGDVAKCPRCKSQLRRTQDMQRATRFEYFRCPHDHGRLTTFFDFLKEKDFVRPLTPQQIAELRKNIQMVNCSNCGAPIDLAKTSDCTHCGSPLSMLDMTQAETLVARLRDADRTDKPVDPALPLALARARREADAAFQGLPGNSVWLEEGNSFGLVGAGLVALARLLKDK